MIAVVRDMCSFTFSTSLESVETCDALTGRIYGNSVGASAGFAGCA